MYDQIYDPINHSLGQSAIFAALPLLTVFVLLGVFKMRAQWAALIALAVSIVVAVVVYSMPVGQTFSAAGEGAAFGLFPIMWIVVNAIWVYTMTVTTGHFDVLRRSFGTVSPDQRIQAIIIAFCFGALLEALAGFGTPVAITSVMLLALGFSKIKAASVALVANTAPVAFGAIAVPITTLAKITNLPEHDIASTVGRQTPVLALIVPLALVFMVDGKRGIRQTWPVAVLSGVVFAVLQFLCSNYISIPLTDIVASLGSALAIVAFLRVWRPSEVLHVEALSEENVQSHLTAATDSAHAVELGGSRGAGHNVGRTAEGGSAGRGASQAGGAASVATSSGPTDAAGPDARSDILKAYAPYLIIIVVFSIAQVGFVMKLLAKGAAKFSWPGLHIHSPAGRPRRPSRSPSAGSLRAARCCSSPVSSPCWCWGWDRSPRCVTT